jgi:hypothetical protein
MPHLVVVALYHLTERALAQHLQDLEAVGHVVVQHDLVVAAVVVEAVVVRVRRLPLPADAVPDVPYLGRQAGRQAGRKSTSSAEGPANDFE